MIGIPPKPIKWPKYPRKLKTTKIPPKHKKKWLKHSRNLINDQNTPKTYKMTKITPKPTKIPPKPKNDQNTP